MILRIVALVFISAAISCSQGDRLFVEKYEGVERVGRMRNEKKIGPWVTKNENGDTLSISTYYNGLLEGCHFLYDSTGRLAELSTFSRGQLDGVRIAFYSTGAIMNYSNYEDGVQINQLYSFYSTGRLESITNFEDGAPLIANAFHENGMKSIVFHFSGQDTNKVFDTLGNLEYEYIMNNGIIGDTLFNKDLVNQLNE